MSKQTAIDNISRNPAPRWGHTEYSLHYHTQYLAERTGTSPESGDLLEAAYEQFSFDFLFNTNNGLINWAEAGRTTDMGHASYAADGSDQRDHVKSPFVSPEEVWAFDAVEEYGLPDFDEQVRAYETLADERRKAYPGQLIPGGYYNTIISGAIASFGWEMLLVGFSDPVKMEKVIDSFFRRTLFFMKAWAETSVEAVIQHDDFVWTSGPFMAPDLYRKIIIPRYAELWKPVHEAGKKLVFCSDGNFMEFTADIVEAGADALVFEPCNDFETLVRELGRETCLVGSCVDCRDLTFEKWDKVEKDIDRTFELLEQCRGAIVAVGNHLPPNIPDEMLDKYFDCLLPKLEK